MGFADDNPGYEITTPDQARNWILEQLVLIEKVRLGCLGEFPGEKQKTAEFQKSAYRKFLEKHGGVLGNLAALFRCQLITKDVYGTLKAKTMALLGPSLVVGRYDSFSNIGRGLTKEQATNWMIEQIDALTLARLDCNVFYPGNEGRTAMEQETADRRLVVKLGGVLGALVALHRCRRLTDVGYNELRAKAMQVVVPTVVGEMHVYR